MRKSVKRADRKTLPSPPQSSSNELRLRIAAKTAKLRQHDEPKWSLSGRAQLTDEDRRALGNRNSVHGLAVSSVGDGLREWEEVVLGGDSKGGRNRSVQSHRLSDDRIQVRERVQLVPVSASGVKVSQQGSGEEDRGDRRTW